MNRKVLICCIVLLAMSLPLQAEVIATPSDFSSARVYPNPWRADQNGSEATMTFDLLPDSTLTTLRIFTIAGEQVRSTSGTRSIPWDLRNGNGQRVASGVYIYLLSTQSNKKAEKSL